jgi:quercetin dioxygenase-like cupin family protein
VLSGSIRTQVDNGKVQVFREGESWMEALGAHHQISENASATKPASLLAIFVVDTNESAELTRLERQ